MPSADVRPADLIITGVLAFVADPDMTRRHRDEPRGFYISWVNDRPDVPKLAVVGHIDPEQVAIAREELSKPEYGLNLELHDDGGFAVVLEGDAYAHVLPMNLLDNIEYWIANAEEALARHDCERADRDIAMTYEQFGKYRERGWPTDWEAYHAAEAHLRATELAFKAVLPDWRGQEAVENDGMRQRLADLVDTALREGGQHVFQEVFNSNRSYTGLNLNLTFRSGSSGEVRLARTDYPEGATMVGGGVLRGSGHHLTVAGTEPAKEGDLKVHARLEARDGRPEMTFSSTIAAFPTPESFLNWIERVLAAGTA